MSSDHGITRRHFLQGSLALPLALTLAAGLVTVPFLRRSDARGFFLRPPGALAERRFLGACVKCGKCAQACPFKAIRLTPMASCPSRPFLAG